MCKIRKQIGERQIQQLLHLFSQLKVSKSNIFTNTKVKGFCFKLNSKLFDNFFK